MRKILNVNDPQTSTEIGTDDLDYINAYLTGVDQSSTDPVNIATTTKFNNGKLCVYNSDQTAAASLTYSGTSNTVIDLSALPSQANPLPSKDMIIYKDSNNIYALNGQSGTTIASAATNNTGNWQTVINDLPTIQAGINSICADGQYHTIQFMPGTYNFVPYTASGHSQSGLNALDSSPGFTIIGYGATFQAFEFIATKINVTGPGTSGVLVSIALGQNSGISFVGECVSDALSVLYNRVVTQFVPNLKKIGSPPGNVSAVIKNAAGSIVYTSPTTIAATSGLTVTSAPYTFDFSTNTYRMQVGDFVAVNYFDAGSDAGNYVAADAYDISAGSVDTTHTQGKQFTNASSTWSNISSVTTSDLVCSINCTASTGNAMLNFNGFTSSNDGIIVKIYGLTVDCNKVYATPNNAGSNNDNLSTQPLGTSCKLLELVDCVFKNPWSTGIQHRGSGGVGGTADATLIIDRCFFDSGTYTNIAVANGGDLVNECINTVGSRAIIITNSIFYGSKFARLSGRLVIVRNCWFDTNGQSQSGGSIYVGIQVQGCYVYLINNRLIGEGYGFIEPNVASDSQYPYESLHHLLIDGAYIDTLGHDNPVTISGLDDTYIIEQATLRNLYIAQGGIKVIDNMYGSFVHSKIQSLVISNITNDLVWGNNDVVDVNSHDIGLLSITNCYMAGTNWVNSNSAPVYLRPNKANSTIGLMRAENLYTLPSKIFGTGGGVTFSATATIEAPIAKTINGINIFNSTPTTVTFIRNIGTASILTGTTSIPVTHNLAYQPTAAQIFVSPTSSLGSATKWWISAIGATTFTINVDQNPGQTVTFAWNII